MSDFLNLMKQRLREEFAASLRPRQACPFTQEQIVHAYEQAYGVMIAYKDAREQKGIDVHHLPRWEMALRDAARGISNYGPSDLEITWSRSFGSNEDMLKAYPLLKGYETMGKLLRIEMSEWQKTATTDFNRWRKRQKQTWNDEPSGPA